MPSSNQLRNRRKQKKNYDDINSKDIKKRNDGDDIDDNLKYKTLEEIPREVQSWLSYKFLV